MVSSGAGLEGVVATSSAICYIDGDAGILSYRGYNIHTLAETPRLKKSFSCCGTAGCPSRRSWSS